MSGELVIPAEELQAPDGYSWRWHCTQKDAEIERLGKELESADRVANDWARQNVELRAENERLREENSTFSDSLAAKADRIDRLGETVARQVAEIERLRADLAAMSDSVQVAAKALNEEESKSERLRLALREILERTSDPVIQAIGMDALGE